MTKQHPITPPPELVQEWASESLATQTLCNRAAQWGSDQELAALLVWLRVNDFNNLANDLLSARRPKPLSLKEQAQRELDRLIALIPSEGALAMAEPIRLALEQLND